MIILDLDHFKLVNDRWGHPIGDKVLEHVGDLTQSNIRKSDILARFGGENCHPFAEHHSKRWHLL